MVTINGMQKTLESWLVQANEALHRMRCCRADTMLDFARLDAVGFVMMVDAMYGMGATITPEVADTWHNIKRGTLKAGTVSQATMPDQRAQVSVP